MGTTDLLAAWAALPSWAQQGLLVAGAVVLVSSPLAAAVNAAERGIRAEGRRPSIWLLAVQGWLNFCSLNFDKIVEAAKRLAELRRIAAGKSPRPPAGGAP